MKNSCQPGRKLPGASYIKHGFWQQKLQLHCNRLPNVLNEALSDVPPNAVMKKVIYNNDQMPGLEDIPSNKNFIDHVSCDVELNTCDS